MGALNTGMTILAWVLVLVATVFAAMSFWEEGEGIRESVMENIAADPTVASLKVFFFLQAYQIVTPAYQFEWIGDEDKKVWFFEEFPLPDSRDIIFIFPFWWLAFFFAKAIWNSNMPGWKAVLLITLMFLLVTAFAWLLVKAAAWYAMNRLAEDIGIDAQTLSEIRRSEFEKTEEYIGIGNSLLLTAAFSIFYLKALLGGSESD